MVRAIAIGLLTLTGIAVAGPPEMPEKWSGYREARQAAQGHPDEWIAPETAEALHAAISAEPVLFYTPAQEIGVLGEGDPLLEAATFGPCIEGAALERLVGALLDPVSYSYGGASGLEYSWRHGDSPRPRMGIVFWLRDGCEVLKTDVEMTRYSFRPYVQLSGGRLRTNILREIARTSFPEVSWSFARLGWMKDESVVVPN
jgi:hypothetical protein